MKIKSDKRKMEADAAKNLNLPDHLVKVPELARDKGSSNWLTTLPLEKYGFSPNKSEFHDALSLIKIQLVAGKNACQVCLHGKLHH